MRRTSPTETQAPPERSRALVDATNLKFPSSFCRVYRRNREESATGVCGMVVGNVPSCKANVSTAQINVPETTSTRPSPIRFSNSGTFPLSPWSP